MKTVFGNAIGLRRQTLLVAFCGIVLAASPLAAQNRGGGGGGGRGGGGGGDRGGGSPSRSDSGSRGDSSARRDYSPPARSDSAPRRDYSPPARSDSSPRRDYSPPARTDSSYSVRRDTGSSSTRSDGLFNRGDQMRSRYYDDYAAGRERDYRRSDGTARGSGTIYRSDSSTRSDLRPVDPFSRDRVGRTDNSVRTGDTPQRDRVGRTDSSVRTGDTPQRDNNRSDDRVRTDGRVRDNSGAGSIFDRRGQGQTGSQRDTTTRDPGAVLRHPGGTERTGGSTYSRQQSGRVTEDAFNRNRAHDLFTRTREGRRYSNGNYLRPGHYVDNSRTRFFFDLGFSFYPNYCPTYDYGHVYYSPYYFYYGNCPPYIYRQHCFYVPPPVIYVEVPVYTGSDARGYDTSPDDYYLRRQYDDHDPDLDRAIDDLRETFRGGNIEPLVQLVDPKVRIAVFQKGKYEYSLESNDYLDMTRDALTTTDTIQFDLYRVQRRAAGVYVVSGKHVYKNRDGQERTVFVSYVLEKLGGRWTLTQVGTAPDHIQDW